MVKNLPASVGDIRDTGSIPGSGRSPAGGNGNPLQYSCLEDPMDRRAWWAKVHMIAKSQTRLKRFNTHTESIHSLLGLVLSINLLRETISDLKLRSGPDRT